MRFGRGGKAVIRRDLLASLSSQDLNVLRSMIPGEGSVRSGRTIDDLDGISYLLRMLWQGRKSKMSDEKAAVLAKLTQLIHAETAGILLNGDDGDLNHEALAIEIIDLLNEIL